MWPHRQQPTRPPVPGILQARILEWIAVYFSNAWKWTVKVKSLSRVWLLTTPWTAAYQAPLSMGFSRQEYWSGVPLPSPHYILLNCKGKMMTLRWKTWQHDQEVNQYRDRWASCDTPVWGAEKSIVSFLQYSCEESLTWLCQKEISDHTDRGTSSECKAWGTVPDRGDWRHMTTKCCVCPLMATWAWRERALLGQSGKSEWSLRFGWWCCINVDFLICRSIWQCGEYPEFWKYTLSYLRAIGNHVCSLASSNLEKC